MKINLLVLSLVFLLPTLQAQRLWVVGSDYVGQYDGENPILYTNMQTEGSSFDPETCQLFVKNKSTQTLNHFGGDESPVVLEKTGKIISEFFGGQFLTLENQDGTLYFRVRNFLGEVTQSVLARWAVDVVSILNFKERGWSLNYSESTKKVSLSRVDNEIQETQQTDGITSPNANPNYRLLYDLISEMTWLGYSKSSAVLELRDSAGTLLNTFQWKEPGDFKDMCLERDGAALLARSLTARSPVGSVQTSLERVRLDGSQQTILKTDSDVLITALGCTNKLVYLSGTNALYTWDRVKTSVDKMMALKGPALKVYACKN